VTTLLDPALYPAEVIADLYLQRWDVEINFRDIKTTMDMDVLRSKTPEMIRKEIVIHLIVYNAIRQLLHQLYQLVAQKIVLDRPGRRGPRAIKRRSKNYQRMTQPGHLMQETPHRGKNLAERA